MRKRCNRFPRQVSALITPDQHAKLVLSPRLHLEMLLNQAVNVDYQNSVLSIFDLAFAVAHLQKKTQVQKQFEAAQKVMIQLINESRSPSSEEGDFLRRCFNQADSHFGLQHSAILLQAVNMVVTAKAEYATTKA